MAKPKRKKPIQRRLAKDITPKSPESVDMGQISTVESYFYRGRINPYNPDDLVGKKGLEIYSKMIKDESVKAALKTKQYAVLASGYKIDPPEVDEGDKEIAEESADFVRFNFEEMEGAFDSKILEIMSGMVYGYAVAEQVWWLIDFGKFSGKVGLKDLRFRKPSGIDFDTDEFGTLVHDGILQGQRRMPKDKFLRYANNFEFSNYYGQSDLREAYRAFWSKDVLLKFMNIALERYGEPTWVFTHAGRLTSDQRTTLVNFIKNLSSKTGMILPEAIKAELKTLGRGAAEAYIPALKLYDTYIRLAILMPGLMGMSSESELGSLARSSTEFDVFMLIVERTRKDIQTAINEQVTKRLIDLNYEVTSGMYPKFAFEVITEAQRQNLYKLWSDGVNSGALTKTREDENRARALIDFEPLPEDVPFEGENREDEQDGLDDMLDFDEPEDEDNNDEDEDEEFSLFHLPGEHDQLDHAPKGTGSIGQSLDTKRPHIKTVVRAEKRLASQTKEHFVAVGATGKIVLAKTGTRDRVSIDLEEGLKLTNATVTHNHPSGGTLSTSDISTAAFHNMNEIRAISKSRFGVNLFVMRRPQKGWPKAWRGADGQKRVLNELVVAATPMRAKYYQRMRSKGMSLREAQEALSHEAWIRVAKKNRITYARVKLRGN